MYSKLVRHGMYSTLLRHGMYSTLVRHGMYSKLVRQGMYVCCIFWVRILSLAAGVLSLDFYLFLDS